MIFEFASLFGILKQTHIPEAELQTHQKYSSRLGTKPAIGVLVQMIPSSHNNQMSFS